MDFHFETRVLKVASERRKLIYDADGLFRKERQKLDVEKYFNFDEFATCEGRESAREILCEYRKQLVLEKTFYEEFHEAYVTEITDLSLYLSIENRQRFLDRALPGLFENNKLRMMINEEKTHAVEKTLELIAIVEASSRIALNGSEETVIEEPGVVVKVESLVDEIDGHLETQQKLAHEQRRRGREGQGFVATLLNFVKNA